MFNARLMKQQEANRLYEEVFRTMSKRTFTSFEYTYKSLGEVKEQMEKLKEFIHGDLQGEVNGKINKTLEQFKEGNKKMREDFLSYFKNNFTPSPQHPPQLQHKNSSTQFKEELDKMRNLQKKLSKKSLRKQTIEKSHESTIISDSIDKQNRVNKINNRQEEEDSLKQSLPEKLDQRSSFSRNKTVSY